MNHCIPALLTFFVLAASSLSAPFAQRLDPKPVNYGPGRIDAADVKKQLNTLEGKTAIVCGRVTTLPRQAKSVEGRSTYLNLGEPSLAREDFRVKILEQDLAMFGDLNEYFSKIVCVQGEIKRSHIDKSRVVPEIVARSAQQISIQPSRPRF